MAHMRPMIWILAGVTALGVVTKGELPLSITVDLLKHEVLLGEPAYATITLLNQTDQPQRLAIQPWGVASLLISKDGKVFYPYHPRAALTQEGYFRWGSSGTRAPFVLAAKGRHRQHLSIHHTPLAVADQSYQAMWFGLPGAGEYLLKACVGDVCSPMVKLKVLSPHALDAKVWDRLRATKFPCISRDPSISLKQDELRAIEEILEEFPNSTYTCHVAYSLARYYQRQRWVDQPSRESAEVARQTELACRYFELAAKTTSISAIREEAMLELAKLKGGAEAIRICDEALQRWPDSFLREEFLRLRAAWQKELELEAMFKPTEDGGLRAERELKAMGYDLDNLTEAERRILAYEIERGTWEECEQRQLSKKECDELLYRRYMDWVMKNLRPVRPAQTNEVGGVTAPLE